MMTISDEPMPDETADETELFVGLIRSAGRRAEPPDASYRATLDIALAAWQAKTARVRARRRVGWTVASLATAAAAALAVLAVTGALQPGRGSATAWPVAAIERQIGALEVRDRTDEHWRPIVDAVSVLKTGTALRTGPTGRAAIRLDSGASLRLAEGTSVTLAAATRIELESGRAYIDSGGTGAGPVVIVTRLGTVRDIGTQFEARLQDDVLRLRVRSGRVQFSHGGLRYESGAGEQLSIAGDRMVERGSIAPTDVDWRWVETLATAPDVDEQPVTRLLDWVARETGRPIRYRDAEVERRAASTILHGSIRHLAPLEALTAMLATTDLEYVELTDGTLLIQSKPTR